LATSTETAFRISRRRSAGTGRSKKWCFSATGRDISRWESRSRTPPTELSAPLADLDIAACPENLGLYVYNFEPGLEIAGREALPYSMLAADLNRDGKPEIILGYVQAPGAVYFNDGTGHKYQRVTFGDSKGAIYGLAADDLDGDGYPDIVAARSGAPSLLLFYRLFGRPVNEFPARVSYGLLLAREVCGAADSTRLLGTPVTANSKARAAAKFNGLF
jgi:hypothetical protein